MVLELLKNENIAVGVSAGSWEEVVEKTGELLLKTDSIEKKYIKAMKKSIIDNGPYVVIGKGVALLHAGPEDGVKKNCLSLITLKDPVEFGSQNNDPVKIAFAFGTVDQKKHLKTISELSIILMQDSAVEIIAGLENPKKILNYIKKILQKR